MKRIASILLHGVAVSLTLIVVMTLSQVAGLPAATIMEGRHADRGRHHPLPRDLSAQTVRLFQANNRELRDLSSSARESEMNDAVQKRCKAGGSSVASTGVEYGPNGSKVNRRCARDLPQMRSLRGGDSGNHLHRRGPTDTVYFTNAHQGNKPPPRPTGPVIAQRQLKHAYLEDRQSRHSDLKAILPLRRGLAGDSEANDESSLQGRQSRVHSDLKSVEMLRRLLAHEIEVAKRSQFEDRAGHAQHDLQAMQLLRRVLLEDRQAASSVPPSPTDVQAGTEAAQKSANKSEGLESTDKPGENKPGQEGKTQSAEKPDNTKEGSDDQKPKDAEKPENKKEGQDSKKFETSAKPEHTKEGHDDNKTEDPNKAEGQQNQGDPAQQAASTASKDGAQKSSETHSAGDDKPNTPKSDKSNTHDPNDQADQSYADLLKMFAAYMEQHKFFSLTPSPKPSNPSSSVTHDAGSGSGHDTASADGKAQGPGDPGASSLSTASGQPLGVTSLQSHAAADPSSQNPSSVSSTDMGVGQGMNQGHARQLLGYGQLVGREGLWHLGSKRGLSMAAPKYSIGTAVDGRDLSLSQRRGELGHYLAERDNDTEQRSLYQTGSEYVDRDLDHEEQKRLIYRIGNGDADADHEEQKRLIYRIGNRDADHEEQKRLIYRIGNRDADHEEQKRLIYRFGNRDADHEEQKRLIYRIGNRDADADHEEQKRLIYRIGSRSADRDLEGFQAREAIARVI
ncbi:unnamed protein product [Sympodiomycopsis kandeliae]